LTIKASKGVDFFIIIDYIKVDYFYLYSFIEKHAPLHSFSIYIEADRIYIYAPVLSLHGATVIQYALTHQRPEEKIKYFFIFINIF